MQKVIVYQFEYFDLPSRSWVLAPDMATEAAIDAIGAVIVRSSALEVESQRVGASGMLRRDTADIIESAK